MSVHNNVLQVYNEDDMKGAIKSRSYRQAIGEALANAYKGMPWRVDVNLAGGIVAISSPLVDPKHEYGYILHLKSDGEDGVARRAVMAGGEILERFRISRTTGDASHVAKRIDGAARTLAQGGY